LEQQVEAEELSNSILIEVSKVSVKKWEEKLNKRYFFKLKNSPYVNFFHFFFVQILDMDGTRLKTAKI